MRRLVLGVALLAMPAALAAQRVRLDARVSPSSVRVGELATVELTVVTSGPSAEFIDAPVLPRGLTLAGTSDFSAYELAPGGRSRTVRRELAIAATSPGRYVLQPMRVRVDGAIYRTGAIRIDVVPAYGRTGAGPGFVAPPAGAPEGVAGAGDDVLLQSWATPDTVFVGEQVTVRADALFSVDIRNRLAGAPQYEAPSGQGFWVYDLPTSDRSGYRPVRGRMYEVQTFRRAFFPLAAGRFFLPGPRLTYAVRRGFLSGPETHEVRGDSAAVVVRPLPASGRPADFAGAVGRYTAAARLESDTVSAGEAATLTVEVRGEGNIKGVPPPRLPSFSGVQVFPPAEDGDVRADEQSVGGVKRFSWVLVPSRPGQIAVPALELPFFDPSQRRYVVARTAPLDLRVMPAVGGVGGSAVATVTLRPIRLRDRGAGAAPWVHAPAFQALMALPLMAFAALAQETTRRRRRRAPGVARAQTGPAMLARLRHEMAALRARAAGQTFSGELLSMIREWLAARLGAPDLAAASPDELERTLRERRVPPETALGIAGLARRLEQAAYMPEPAAPSERVVWLDEAEALLAAVHDEARRHRRTWRRYIVALLLFAAWLSPWASSAAAQGRGVQGLAQPTGTAADVLTRGAAAYERGQFTRAAELLAGYVAVHQDHADGWYDLGNAEYRARHHGRAVWAWLRALELRPRDGDTRQNLALAGVDGAVVDAASPPLPFSTDELALGAGLLWLAGAGLLLAWRFAGRRALAGAAAASLVVAAVLAATGAYATHRPAGAVVLAPAAIMGAPNLHADSLGQLKEGEVVEVREGEGGWTRIRAAPVTNAATGERGDPREGWVDRDALGVL